MSQTNKLPPLPEPTILPSGHYVHGVIVFNADQMRAYAMTHAASLQAKIDALMLEYCPDEMTPEQMQTWAAHQVPSSAAEAEALRQSQSLPAGAVAGLVGKWRDRYSWAAKQAVEARNDNRHRAAENYETTAMFANEYADEMEEALQADAREKGEAVDPIDAALEAFAVKPSTNFRNESFADARQCLINTLIASKSWGRAYAEAYVDEFADMAATQPAQASEKDNG